MKLDIVIPIFQDYKLVNLCINSIQKYTPSYNIRYIVIENIWTLGDEKNTDKNYSTEKNVLHLKNYTSKTRSEGNACALYYGSKFVDSENVLLLHNDVVMCNYNWFDILNKEIANNLVTGFLHDTTRIKAVHISGLYTKTWLYKKICDTKKIRSLL